MAWLPDGEKNFGDIFIRFDATHERDRHTDIQTDGQTPHDSIGGAYASHRSHERDGRTDGHRVTAHTALMHMHRAVMTVHAESV